MAKQDAAEDGRSLANYVERLIEQAHEQKALDGG
jgi:hypothetical protein